MAKKKKPQIPAFITLAEGEFAPPAEKATRCAGQAYSGGPIRQRWSDVDVYIDLAGMEIAPQVTIQLNHSYAPEHRLGVARVANDGRTLQMAGEFDDGSYIAQNIIRAGKRYAWQLSIGCENRAYQAIPETATAAINGRTIAGPALIVTKSLLREVSVVALGADADTWCDIVAALSAPADGTEDAEDADGKAEDTAATASEDTDGTTDGDGTTTASRATAATGAPCAREDGDAGDRPNDAEDGASGAENGEDAEAPATPATPPDGTTAAASLFSADSVPPAKAPGLPTPPKETEEDTNMAEELTAKLEAMEKTIATLQARLDEQAARPAPEIAVKRGETPKAEILACAIEQSMGIEQNDTRAAEMASRTYRGQLGLRQLYTEAAQAAGWTGSYITNGNFGEASNAIKAGFSNLDLPGLLGNAVNKRIKAGYDYAESSWREIAEITSVADYKAFSTYTLNAKGDFEEVPNGGTIPHGELAETGYSNQLKRYGQMFQIDEIDVINDDLGAINARAFGFGRKAALKLNKVFWAKFQDDADFFKAANGNLVTGATPLSVSSLGQVVKAFRGMKDANGDILGYVPAVLLVPTALEVEALKLYNDAEMRDTAANKTYLTGNPFRSQFKPVASAYLASATDYYLLAAPGIAAPIQVAFLNGQTAPAIESSAAEFDVFGIRWRAKFSFGVAFADAKAGVKATA